MVKELKHYRMSTNDINYYNSAKNTSVIKISQIH